MIGAALILFPVLAALVFWRSSFSAIRRLAFVPLVMGLGVLVLDQLDRRCDGDALKLGYIDCLPDWVNGFANPAAPWLLLNSFLVVFGLPVAILLVLIADWIKARRAKRALDPGAD